MTCQMLHVHISMKNSPKKWGKTLQQYKSFVFLFLEFIFKTKVRECHFFARCRSPDTQAWTRALLAKLASLTTSTTWNCIRQRRAPRPPSPSLSSLQMRRRSATPPLPLTSVLQLLNKNLVKSCVFLQSSYRLSANPHVRYKNGQF
jgi:hypothetical protein